MVRIRVAVSVFLAAALGLSAFAADHTKDTLADVKKAIADGKAVLIDVREADEWKVGHLKDARHLALSEIRNGVNAERLQSLMPKDKIVYLHCAAGGRCLKAADLLKKAGIESRPLKPGYEELVKNGLDRAK